MDCWKTMHIWTIVEEYMNYCKIIFDNCKAKFDNCKTISDNCKTIFGLLQENLDNCMPKFRSNIRTNVKVNAKQNLKTKNV